jgi:hypothetical protein
MKKGERIEGESLVSSSEKSLREAIIDRMGSSPNSGVALLINGRYFPALAEKGNVLDAACFELRRSPNDAWVAGGWFGR